MRVLVSLSAADYELINELEKIEPRNRAARLRTLATVGLLAQKNGLENSSILNNTDEDPAKKAVPPSDDSDKRQSLKSRLVSSLS